jgi:hypothetical protein
MQAEGVWDVCLIFSDVLPVMKLTLQVVLFRVDTAPFMVIRTLLVIHAFSCVIVCEIEAFQILLWLVQSHPSQNFSVASLRITPLLSRHACFDCF